MAKKKGIKISNVKRSNHLRHKLVNRGKLKRNKSKAYKIYRPQNPKPIEEENKEEDNIGEQMLEMMDEDDALFLERAITERSYNILKRLRDPEKKAKRRGQGKILNENDSLESMYEDVMNQPDAKRTKLLLPIKTKDGVVMRSTKVDVEEEERKELERQLREQRIIEDNKNKKKEKKEKKKKENEKEEDEEKEEEEEEKVDEEEEEDELEAYMAESEQVVPQSVATVDLLVCREELIRKRKFQIGLLASGLLENPENKIRNFKLLLDIMNTDHSEVKLTVRKLATLSLLEVFKDLIPAYQIKHPQGHGGRVKKTTMQLQNYEKSLLKAYKEYLKYLEKMAKSLQHKRGDHTPRDPKKERLGLVAIQCMSELLVRHPYFNFAPNIALALVHFLDINNKTVNEIVSKGLKTVLREDKRGEISLHIVRRINFLVKKKETVQPEVVSVLLALRLRDINLDTAKEAQFKGKQLKNKKHKLLHVSRRERRRQKRIEDIEKELLETKAQESKEVKTKNLTEITKFLFTIFFRILKSRYSSKLLSVTLEGLAKFAHCINLDFFQDIVNVLDNLLEKGEIGLPEQLHCVETVFIMLSGQGEALNIDPMRFYTHLYCSLVELHGGCTNRHALTAVRTLEKAVLGRRRQMSFQRLLAFIKRLCNLAPHLMHGTALGFLSIVRNVLMQAKTCEVLMDIDSSHGDGIYQPELPGPDYCNAGASVLWELSLLKRHYHPQVRKMTECIAKGKEYTILPEISSMSPSVLAETYDSDQMAFRPAVPPPRKSAPAAFKGQLTLTSDEFQLYLKNIEDSVTLEGIKDFKLPKRKELKSENLQG